MKFFAQAPRTKTLCLSALILGINPLWAQSKTSNAAMEVLVDRLNQRLDSLQREQGQLKQRLDSTSKILLKQGQELNEVHLRSLRTATLDSLGQAENAQSAQKWALELKALRAAVDSLAAQDSVKIAQSAETIAAERRRVDQVQQASKTWRALERKTGLYLQYPLGFQTSWHQQKAPLWAADTSLASAQISAKEFADYEAKHKEQILGYGWFRMRSEDLLPGSATDLSLALGRGWSGFYQGGLEGFFVETGAGLGFFKSYCDDSGSSLECSETSDAKGPLLETMTLDHSVDLGWVVMRQSFSPQPWPAFWDALSLRASVGLSQHVGLFSSNSEGFSVARRAMEYQYEERSLGLWAWDYHLNLGLGWTF
jgi:hypothetical protein